MEQITALVEFAKIMIGQQINKDKNSFKNNNIDAMQDDKQNIKSNSDNPRIGSEFEKVVRKALEYKLKVKFYSQSISIGNPPKPHSFDAVSEDRKIIAECKSYTWTKTGNVPSAKLATLNETILYLSKAPNDSEKIIVLKRDLHETKKESLAEYFVRLHYHLLEDICVMEYDRANKVLNIIKEI